MPNRTWQRVEGLRVSLFIEGIKSNQVFCHLLQLVQFVIIALDLFIGSEVSRTPVTEHRKPSGSFSLFISTLERLIFVQQRVL